MPTPQDIEAQRIVRREIARRPIDSTLLHIQINHGIVILRGQVRPMRGHQMDIHEEMQHIVKAIKQRPGIRDVILDVTYRL